MKQNIYRDILTYIIIYYIMKFPEGPENKIESEVMNMKEIRDPEAVMTEAELVDTVNKVIDLVGTYSELRIKSSELSWCLNVKEDEYNAVSKEASATYRDILEALYGIANTYTIDGRTENFAVRVMRRRKENE